MLREVEFPLEESVVYNLLKCSLLTQPNETPL